MSEFRFRSISWEENDRISPNFVYALILTISMLGLLPVIFLHICTRVMALDSHQNLVSAEYLENKLAEFHQILYMDTYWHDLSLDCYMSFFTHLYQSYSPWFTPEFRFCSISCEQIDRISPNFIYAFILTRSTLGLLLIIFRTFVPEEWHLIYVEFRLHSISW